jgi:hypothetical protein
VNRRAAAQARRSGTGAAADRPRQRRCARTGRVPRRRPRASCTASRSASSPTRRPTAPSGSAVRVGDGNPLRHVGHVRPLHRDDRRGTRSTDPRRQPDVAFLLNHGGMTLARTASGTLTICADDVGLWYRGPPRPAELRRPRHHVRVRRGDLSRCRSRSRSRPGQWSPDYMAYRIEAVDLHKGDVSTSTTARTRHVPDRHTRPPPTTTTPTTTLDVDALDDEQALALAGRLQQRARREHPRHHDPRRARRPRRPRRAAPPRRARSQLNTIPPAGLPAGGCQRCADGCAAPTGLAWPNT